MSENIEPISHLEKVIAYYGIGGGSGSGTSDYDALQNKPSINGVELSGNKTLTDLGIKNYVYYFNSVSDMKSSTKLKAGDMVITKGYYQSNDGGNGEYEIVDNSTLVDDGGSIHDLSNGLKAKLIIKNGSINIKQLGAKSEQDCNFSHEFDCRESILRYISILSKEKTRIKLLIPSGIYLLSETLLNIPSGFDICGDFGFIKSKSLNGTIFAPFKDNQKYVIKLGGNSDYSNPWEDSLNCSTQVSNFSFKNITISTAVFNKNGVQTFYKTKIAAFIVDSCEFGVVDNIFFRYIYGSAMWITTSWEIYFGTLNFRNILDHNSPCLLFDTVWKNTHGNISACEFNSIMFEACNGDYIKSSAASAFDQNKFGNINIEASFYNEGIEAGTMDKIVNPIDLNNSIHESVFRLGQFNCVHIDNITIQHMGNYYHNINDCIYIRDIIINIKTNATITTNINNIQYEFFETPIKIINSIEPLGSLHSKSRININNIMRLYGSESATTKPIFNIKYFPYININNISLYENGYHDLLDKSNNGVIPAYKSVYTDAFVGRLLIDNESINGLKICLSGYSKENSDRIFKILNIPGKKIMIRAKIKKDVEHAISMNGNISGSYTYNGNNIFTGSGNFEWYTLENNNFDEYTEIDIKDISKDDDDMIIFDCYRYIDA